MGFMRNIIGRAIQRENGQMLLMFVLLLVVMIGFVGLGVDLGFAYITRAKLSKAVDSACLNGMRNYWQGTAQASLIASNTFVVNYGTSGRDVAPPSLAISFVTSNQNTVLNVQASVAINTFFIRVMPAIGGASWKTLTVGSSAQATRTKVILALVLDHSGSMDPSHGPPPTGDGCGSGGGSYLPNAVTTFINFFSDSIDEASMASFGSTATLNVPMEQPFKSDITTAASNLFWCGGTFSQGGLTNALVQENGVTIPANQVALQVVVFFTDGLANMIQDTLNCPTPTLWNFGGEDTPTPSCPEASGVFFFSPTAPDTCPGQNNYSCFVVDGNTPSCCNVTQFHSNQNGMESLTRANVTAEAQFRCIQTANDMRNNGILVYSIGLGGATDVNLPFLAQVANATNYPQYNPSLPVGLALLANDPSQLQTLFTQVANDILFRLTQ
jgi:Flp pilus assembly protein TadG